uniref:Uncharacterized protein n=1 Tax=Clytia hemisphaerica TaxID=252671 RepID=A0A7M5X4J5_9CNID
MGVWYKQLGLLLWKNFLIQSRRKLSTLFEILLPIFFVLILLILRITTIKSKHHDDPTLWNPFQMNRTIPLNKNPDSSSIPNIVNRNPYMDNKPFYTVKKWSIAYAPNNSETRFIMSNLKTFLDANVDAFESPEEMIKNVV